MYHIIYVVFIFHFSFICFYDVELFAYFAFESVFNALLSSLTIIAKFRFQYQVNLSKLIYFYPPVHSPKSSENE